MLLRLLFPSWAFFDAVTAVPRLEVRVMVPGAVVPDVAPGDWEPALVVSRRGLRHLLYNPEGTETLALQAIIDGLAVECEAGIEDPVTRGLVERVAARAVRTLEAAAPDRHRRWQWQVVAVDVARRGSIDGPAGQTDHEGCRVLYRSAWYNGGDTTGPDSVS